MNIQAMAHDWRVETGRVDLNLGGNESFVMQKYDEGMSPSVLSHKFGVPINKVYNLIKSTGRELRGRNATNGIDEKTKQKVRSMLKAGRRNIDVAKETGVNKGTVCTIKRAMVARGELNTEGKL